jgi:uncharacterized tellurite resistance protein B-like protein
MLDALKKLFGDLGDVKSAGQFEENDYRVAAAAILIHVMAVDGAASDVERNVLRDVLKSGFDLDDVAVAELIEMATTADRDALDLYHFTSVLNRSLDQEGRQRIVEMMWELVFADGRVNEFEDNVVWRAADLLGLSSRERIGLRQRVAERTQPAAEKLQTNDC